MEDFGLALSAREPHVILAEHSSPSLDSLDVMVVLRERQLSTPLIVFTRSLDEHEAVKCTRAGVEDIVLHEHAERLPSAIDAAIRSHERIQTLSARQLQVIRLIAQGQSNRIIAGNLRLSVKTVESHRMAIMKRLGVHEISALVRIAMRLGLIANTNEGGA